MWYTIENAYMLETAVIGVGGFVLSLEGSKKPIKGSFKKTIITKGVASGALATIAIVLAIGAAVLWPKQEAMSLVATTNAIQKPQPIPTAQDTVLVAQQPPIPKQIKSHTVKRQQVSRQTSTIDSLQYYIARLEHELENVSDSTYTAKAEQVIRADARLQKLVQRIMIGELTKDDVQEEAMNINKTTEEQP
jgi:hypothetical protein